MIDLIVEQNCNQDRVPPTFPTILRKHVSTKVYENNCELIASQNHYHSGIPLHSRKQSLFQLEPFSSNLNRVKKKVTELANDTIQLNTLKYTLLELKLPRLLASLQNAQKPSPTHTENTENDTIQLNTLETSTTNEL